MTKLQSAAVTAAFAAGVATHVGFAALSQPASNELTVVNMKLVREDLADGGVQWNARSCGYEWNDKHQRLGEPCWQSILPGNTVLPVERAVLEQKK